MFIILFILIKLTFLAIIGTFKLLGAILLGILEVVGGIAYGLDNNPSEEDMQD